MCLVRRFCVLFFFFFFFSSRRRHTRCSRDWSSDVCSSDLWDRGGWRHRACWRWRRQRSEERRVGKSVDLGGRRIIKKKKKRKKERDNDRQKEERRERTVDGSEVRDDVGDVCSLSESILSVY